MKNHKISMCDVAWWDRLKTTEEKDAYCKEHYNTTYAEFMDEVEHPKYRYDKELRKLVPIENEPPVK